MTTHVAAARRMGATMIACTTAAAVVLLFGSAADAAIVPTVHLATAGSFSVLGASTVTNTGGSVLGQGLGLSPGPSITGFPPGIVLGATHNTDAAAAGAQSDLTAAYIDAAGRPIDGTTTANLANLHLGAGVYAGPSHGALSLTGPLVLDGAGNMNSVFIFQTNSSLITASGSTVSLVNGAQECNVFWQVGSSATLGTGSVFTGNILALTSITVNNSVTVHGRALARNGAVTLDNDTFTRPSCANTPVPNPIPTPTTTPGAGTGGGGGGGGTTPGAGGTTGTTGGTGTTAATTPGTGTGLTSTAAGVPPVSGPPRTGGGPLRHGSSPWPTVLLGSLIVSAGTAGVLMRRRLQGRSASLAQR